MALTKVPSELSSTPGIVDNSNATAITISSSENVTFSGTATMGGLEIATSASDIGVDLKLDGNKTSNGAIGSIIFENNGDSVGMIRSNRASANDAADMLFYTQATGGNNTQRMAITKDGNLLVGKTSTGDYVTGIEMQPAGAILSYRTGGVASIFGRTDNGEITRFTTASAIKGQIATTTSAGGSRLAIGGEGDIGIIFAGTGIFPASTVTASDGAADLGSSSYRWKDLYLSGKLFINNDIQMNQQNGRFDYDGGASGGAMRFFSTSANAERARFTSGGRLLIGTTGGNYTHDKGLRVVSGEVGSHVLDAVVSIEGSGGDFYPINFTGPSNTGFGALLAFSPSTDYLVWQYRSGGTSNNILFMRANGSVTVSGALSKGSGSFRIDHPLPAKTSTHDLVHSFIEGPQADLIYRGKVTLVGGSATVNVDTAAGMTEGTFEVLCADVQCFTSNESGWTAVKGSVSGNTLTITAQDNTCTDTISWMVVGERKDQHMIDTDWTDANGKVIVEPLKENN